MSSSQSKTTWWWHSWLFTHPWHVRCTTKRVGGSAIPSPSQGLVTPGPRAVAWWDMMSWLYSKWLGWANINKTSSSNPIRTQMLMYCFLRCFKWLVHHANSKFCSNGKKSPLDSSKFAGIVNLNLPTYIHSLRKPHTNHRETRPLAIKPISADCVVVSLMQVTTRPSALIQTKENACRVKNLGESFGPSSKTNK